MNNPNPYATPCDVRKGVYDRSLMKRVLKFVAVFALFMAVIAAASSWRYFQHSTVFRNMTPVEQAKAFFFNWHSQER